MKQGLTKKHLKIGKQEISYLEEGQGENVILLPGLGCNCELWASVIPFLSKNYHLISLSLPLYGSINDQGRPYNFDTYPDLIASVVNYLGWDQFYLCGHSLGSIISIRYSNTHPGKVRKMILASAPLTDHKEKIPLIVKAGIKLIHKSKRTRGLIQWAVNQERVQEQLSRLVLSKENLEKKNQKILDFLETVPLSAIAACYNDALHYNFEKDVGAIKVPTLFVYGEKDKPLKKFGGTKLYPKVKNAKIVSLDSHHFIPTDAPQELASLISEFIKDEQDRPIKPESPQ